MGCCQQKLILGWRIERTEMPMGGVACGFCSIQSPIRRGKAVVVYSDVPCYAMIMRGVKAWP